jgi:hypothetical protein
VRMLLVLLGAGLFASETAGETLPPVQVMVLGTYHMGNPGLDLHNVQADDVLTSERQAQLEAVVDSLASFRPTVVAVERVTARPAYEDARYESFGPAALAQERDERVQLGYRLARRAGLARVHGIDEQPAAGEPDYFPFERVQDASQRNGTDGALAELIAQSGRTVDEFARRQGGMSIAELLIAANDRQQLADPAFYFALLPLDVGEDQPGAELLGYWFMRNAKIVARLADVVRPGDRVVVLYGAGHKHWLEAILQATPGFELVDPVRYLSP